MVVTYCCKDSKTALQIEIVLIVHELHDSFIYINKVIAKLVNRSFVFILKTVSESLQQFSTTLIYIKLDDLKFKKNYIKY